MRSLAAALLLASIVLPAAWPAHAQSQSYVALRSDEPLQDRIAYLLTLFDSAPEVGSALQRDPALSAIDRRLRATSTALLASCEASDPPRCAVEQLMLTDAEIEAVAQALERLAANDPAVGRLVSRHLRPSGRYQTHAALRDPELLNAAWRDAAAAVNRIYKVYGLGEKPLYPAIDSLDRDTKDARFQSRLGELIAMGSERQGRGEMFAPWVHAAFDLLTLAQRDEAARYEPLDTGANGPANRFAKSIDWNRYRYTAILVPGNGLNPGERAVSPIGVLRLRLAAERWRSKLAPLIVLSGGHVHPNRSEYSEAVEMKKALMTRFGLPEKVILIDPYARHTTTNLRNAVRLLFRAGAPMSRPFLVTSSPGHAAYVADADKGGLAERSERELGYVPFRNAKVVSAVDTAVLPDLVALQIDSDEPLDP